MKLVTFSTHAETSNTQPATPAGSVPAAALSLGIPTPGALIGNEVVDLSSLGYPTVLDIIAGGAQALEEIKSQLPKAPRLLLSQSATARR